MVTKIKCAVVDDEPLARQVLLEYIKVVDYLDLVCEVDDALGLNKALDDISIDLIFLDIHMPHLSGLDFLKIHSNLPMIVITTAYPDYALEGFQFNVLDYVVKPITFNRFFKAANKAREQFVLKYPETGGADEKKEEPYFFVKCENKYEKILTNEVLFIQAFQNYVIIQTSEEKHLSLMPLKTIEDNLDAASFVRVHKSYLVAISHIKTLENHELILTNGLNIPISRNFRKTTLEKVLQGKVIKKNSK